MRCECATAVRAELAARDAGLVARGVQFRIGIHLGDVLVEGDGDIHGDGVNIAARLESLAAPGGICISGSRCHDQVRHKLVTRLRGSTGATLKNVVDPVRVYRVRLALGEAEDRPTTLTVPGFAGRPAIAVLAFDNLSGDPEQEYFADGIAEDLITRLSLWRSFPVIARNSSFVYKGKAVDVKQVGADLGVRYVVEGSVRKAADQVRISAQVVDANTGHHLWADPYDRTLRDVFALQDEIVERIIGSLLPTLGRAEREPCVASPPELGRVGLRATRLVARVPRHAGRRGGGALPVPQGRGTGRALLPRLQRPGHESSLQLGYQWSETPAQSLREGLQAAEKAVALGEGDPQSHVALGLVRTNAGQYERAVVAAERIIELNPSAARAIGAGAVRSAYLDHPDQGVGLIEKAIRLSPRDPAMHEFLFDLGVAHFLSGRYEEAIVWEKKSLRSRPGQPGAYRVLAASYGHLGRIEEARAALDAMCELAPDFSVETLRVHVPGAIVIVTSRAGARLAGRSEPDPSQ